MRISALFRTESHLSLHGILFRILYALTRALTVVSDRFKTSGQHSSTARPPLGRPGARRACRCRERCAYSLRFPLERLFAIGPRLPIKDPTPTFAVCNGHLISVTRHALLPAALGPRPHSTEIEQKSRVSPSRRYTARLYTVIH